MRWSWNWGCSHFLSFMFGVYMHFVFAFWMFHFQVMLPYTDSITRPIQLFQALYLIAQKGSLIRYAISISVWLMWVKNTSHSLKKDALVLLIFSGQYAFVKACISKRCFSFTCIRCFSVLCIKISANIHNMKGKSPRSMPAKFYSQVRHSPYIISGAGVSFER